MGFTSANLINDGRTDHYLISYDETFPPTAGQDRANALLAVCEQDFAMMASWFPPFLLPLFAFIVQIANDSGGGKTDTSDGLLYTITLKNNDDPSLTTTRYLLVAEVTEIFMKLSDRGWVADHDEGSKGEGLSRFLGVQFVLENRLGSAPPNGFDITKRWLNSSRIDYVTNNPDTHEPNEITGCTTLFLYYLHDQLGKSINEIISAGSSNLAGVYQKVTGRTDGWDSFQKIVNNHYPPGFEYHPLGDAMGHPRGDNIFPVSELSGFLGARIVSGYSGTMEIFIDRQAMAEVHIQLTSDDQSLFTVPPIATINPGAMSTFISIATAVLPVPFTRRVVNVHARYAGKTLTAAIEVVPPSVVSVTLFPDTVVGGDSTTVTVTLDRPSLLGDVVVEVFGQPFFAPIPKELGGDEGQGHLTIPQNEPSTTFDITTPDISCSSGIAEIMAVYLRGTDSESFASAWLTVKPSVPTGAIASLTLSPSTVIGGQISHAIITLEDDAPTEIVVGLAALEPETGLLPLPGNESSLASIDSPASILAGRRTARFTISTKKILPGTGSRHAAVIVAGTCNTKFATLTITS